MKKRILLMLFAVTAIFAQAQVNAKYLDGAVPEEDGKVVFSKTIATKNPIAANDLFGLMEKWAQARYNGTDNDRNRVALENLSELNIACLGEAPLTFKRSALVLDQARINYQLILKIKDNACQATVRSIKYEYSDNKSLVPAEEMISDKVALNKKKQKLYRNFDKFRIHTVDSINALFNSIDVYLNGTQGAAIIPVQVQPAVPAPTQQQAAPAAVSVAPAAAPVQSTAGEVATMNGYKRISADKIPGNIIKLLDEWTLITSGTADQMNVMTASWGGLGAFWGKPVSMCFLNPTRYSVQTMDKGEVYTISFYTETYKDAMKYCGSTSGRTTDKIKGSGLTPIKLPSGATAFSEAWMIFECRKIVAQQISPEAVMVKPTDNDWTKNGYHKMYMGEILNVWVK